MSKMRSDRRPPLARSPLRLRSRRVPQSNSTTSIQTPPGSLTKSQKMIRPSDLQESELRPEYRTISCELRALASMVRMELGCIESEGNGVGDKLSVNSSSLFERGRFYDEYSARRNERLKKRKKAETVAEVKTPYNLGVTVESSKRQSSKKLVNSLRKSVSAAYSAERSETAPRYLLRSMMKENKKPPLPVNLEKSMIGGGERKMVTRRARRI
ncbi:hypothetical protein IC582_005909 [Cucumis melo]|uniref:Uncharacterized protein LOC103502623 n=3 Tax=Cucumis melo TaxID=3656 RepID=A0A1S3CME4_CUCME|nr:uncharacterized protein LOC103502623 [Cucumis melo]ADN33991.1 hypothetical protein [Cucumis melo subsp. melo]KAA0038452.1 uncharacterized protein E6C27_scaffold119G00190 [Cucumis melo var. makuwa]